MKTSIGELNVEAVDPLLDHPIGTAEADRLGFREVAQSLVDAIEAQPNDASLTLGLDGVWGSGKSSILRLLRGSVAARPQSDGIGLVVVPFSPWLITNRTALVAAFFAQIADAVDQAERRIPRNWRVLRKDAAKHLAWVRKRIHGFSRVVSILSTAASAFDPTLLSAIAAGGTSAVEKLTADGGKRGKSLETLKAELTAALSVVAAADPSFRILVLVDDLDRLDPGDAVEVLRLVKAVGDFPAITYLLAYDRAALSRAVEHTAGIENGDTYLEKIIQFSFKVPPPEPFQLRNWLRTELDNLFPDTFVHSSGQAAAVLDTWAGRLLSTPRDVKRLLFAVRAMWPKLRERADLLDLVWLQMIAQKASSNDRDLYSWVVGYLQGLEAVAIGGAVTGKEKERERLVTILKTIGWNEYKHDEDGMRIDFHHLDELLAGVTKNHLSAVGDGDWTYKIEDKALERFRDGKRLSSPWHWRLYFAFDTPSHAITDDEWKALVAAAEKSTAELGKSLVQVLEFRSGQRQDAADQIVGRAINQLLNGSLLHPDRWIIAVVEQADAMTARSKKDGIFGFSRLFEANARTLARHVFKAIAHEERQAAIAAIFGNMATISTAASLLRDQFHASRKEGHEREERLYLSDGELQDVIAKQVVLYEALTPSDLRSLSSPYDVLFAWRDVTEEGDGPAKLLQESFKTDSGFLETLSALRYISSSSQNGIPHIPEDYLKPFLDTEQLHKRLEGLTDSGGEHSEQANELFKLWWSRNR